MKRDAWPGGSAAGLAEDAAAGSGNDAGAFSRLPMATTGLSTDLRWPAQLRVCATRDGAATRVRAQHRGPLRLLKTLYPEGPGIAHAVVVHPPGGLVGGDHLAVSLDLQPGAHLLATTPSATRFYRSTAGVAAQLVQARVASGARLEWLPQETLAYSGCQAHNALHVDLAEDAGLMASELLVLGLAQTGQHFAAGQVLQHLEIGGLWLDRGRIAAHDRALLDGPCGLAGHRVLGTLVLAHGRPGGAPPPWQAAVAELLQATRDLLASPPCTPSAGPTGAPTGVQAGVSCLQGRLLLLRVLAHELEPATALLRLVRALWRQRAWGLAACEPRVWAT